MLPIFQYSFLLTANYYGGLRSIYKFYHMLTTKSAGNKRKIDNSASEFKLYASINDKSQLLRLKPGYIIQPSASEIFEKKFMINDLTIKFMSTTALWKGKIDLRNLKAPLSELIELGRTHIEVYPNQREKPLAGRELNRICFVTFGNLKALNRRRLRQICQSNECELLSINEAHKQFTVQIPHFSKYSFDAEVSENQEENENKIPEIEKKKVAEGSDVSKLKQIHNFRIMAENEQVRQNLNIEMIQKLKKNTVPTPQLLKEIEQHNRNHEHKIVGDRIKGIPVTIGVNCAVSSFINSPTIHFMLFNKPKQQKRDLLDLVMQLIKDEKRVNQFILSPDVTYEVKRVLVLNIICFNFGQCLFDFQRVGQKLELVGVQTPPDAYYRQKYFKNWFEWVVSFEEAPLQIKNEMTKALVLRKTAQQAQKCEKFNQKGDAEFLSSIEDESYRNGEPPKKLSKELLAVSIGDMSNFQNLSWLYRFAVTLWYYSFNESIEQKLRQILRQNIKDKEEFNLERSILCMLLKVPFNDEILTGAKQSQYPLWFYIENRNKANLSLQTDPKLQRKYATYRYNLVYQLINQFPESNVVQQLVSYDNFIEKDNKISLLKNFINRYPDQAERIPVSEWKQYSDQVNQMKAYAHYSNGQFLKCLEAFGQCSIVSLNACQVLARILVREEIICGFHKKTIDKTKRLIEKLKLPSNFLDLKSDIVTYLNISLGRQQITKKTILSMLKLSTRISKQVQRKRMLQIVFKQAIKTPLIIAQLKKDGDQNNLYQAMKMVYVDPSYLLELKLARLQL